MNWKDYTKEKPTKENEEYLIAVSWHPDVLVYDIATWKGKHFENWNHYDDCSSKVEDVKYWCKIEEPETN